MPGTDRVRLVATTIHGRVLVREPEGRPRGLIIGFHGYVENAAIQMERLAAMPGAAGWTLLSVQGLHRFYRGRSANVVSSWMTSEDRDIMIADNIAYVDAAVETIALEAGAPIVCAGFSQGVAMAFRSGVRGRRPADGIIAVGGDVPPELVVEQALRFPPVLLARGARDEWLTPAKFDADAGQLSTRGVAVEALTYDGAHEWNAAVSDAAGAFLSKLDRR
jgi:predicted esterase